MQSIRPGHETLIDGKDQEIIIEPVPQTRSNGNGMLLATLETAHFEKKAARPSSLWMPRTMRIGEMWRAVFTITSLGSLVLRGPRVERHSNPFPLTLATATSPAPVRPGR